MNNKVYCIIPAWNEEGSLSKVLDDIKEYDFTIIVVDDGSDDNTAEIARAHNVILLSHIINRGQGAALRTGTEYALRNGASIIVHFDADGQFLSSEIDALVHPLRELKADIVFGSRFLGKHSHIPLTKKLFIFPLARLFNFIFWRLKTSDPQCGFRAMTREAAAKIIIEQDGMAHCTEILAKASLLKLRIVEVPVTVIYHDFGQNMHGGLKIIKEILLNKFLRI